MKSHPIIVALLAPALAAVSLLGLSGVRSFAASTQASDASCTPNGTQLSITAFDGKFNKNCLAAPANTAFTIDFKNLDRGIPHNVAIYQDETAAKNYFKGDLVDGPGETTYSVPALPPGRWFFRCDPHPDMNGTFIVGNPAL
jgi:plastocyanin